MASVERLFSTTGKLIFARFSLTKSFSYFADVDSLMTSSTWSLAVPCALTSSKWMAPLSDLKLVVKKKVNDVEESTMGHRHISWKHVWENFCLAHHSEKLLNDTSALQDYGVRNNSQVQFLPYVVSRAFRKHSTRRKHRFFHGLNIKA